MAYQSEPIGSGEAGASTSPNRATQEPGMVVDARSLGLAAFATTTFVFGLSYTTIWSASASVAATLGLALVFGGVIQILAGIWAFARRQTFAAVAFCSFGAFYASYYLFTRTIAAELDHAKIVIPGLLYAKVIAPGLHSSVSTALALFLLAWLIFTTYVLLASIRVSPVATGVVFFWWLAYLLLVIGEFTGNVNVSIGGGAAAIVAAGVAWYGSGAMLVNDTFGKSLLPLVRPWPSSTRSAS